ncbi:MAG: DUF1294 domain-containing protein [Oscillibacter sp.]|jgi:uncharacterized membrane protein YsdA (DUF1294 family)|nr:DUF1294 domain-containing protein [uncultured Oscillibacter sp.]MCI9645174.1 DUF1294 domain-containing protein [Oscillibacter sp.]
MNIALLSAVSREKALFLPEARNDFIWAVVGSPWGLLAIWLVLINVITFFVFGADKLQAKRKEKKDTVRRVPEKNLLLLAAAGGSIGALLGMKAFHHKTLHKAFKIGVPVILALQIIIPFGLWLYFAVIR